jgi:hypothetical protein
VLSANIDTSNGGESKDKLLGGSNRLRGEAKDMVPERPLW